MISVPLPVKMSWYAYHYAAQAAEAQLRMTHAMWMAMVKAHPLAPHGLEELKKVAPGKPAPRKAVRPKARPAKTVTVKAPKPATSKRLTPGKQAVAAPTVSKAPAPAPAPSAPAKAAEAKAPAKPAAVKATAAKVVEKAPAPKPAVKPKAAASSRPARKRRAPSAPPSMPGDAPKT